MTRAEIVALAHRPRRLPLIDKPATREHIGSYTRRLGQLNRTDDEDMAELLGTKAHLLRSRRPFVHINIIDRLAVLTGYSTDRLSRVFPPTTDPPPAPSQVEPLSNLINSYHSRPLRPCEHCTATRRPTYSILRCWRLREQRVCVRHRRWIGSGGNVNDTDQIDLTGAPEITTAGRRLTSLVAKHGRNRVLTALRLAEQCVHENQLDSTDTFDQRADRLGIGDRYLRTNNLTHAVAFPEVIALTRLLCSGHWRTALANPDHTTRAAAQQRFEAQVNTDLRPLWEWSINRHEHLLAQWVYSHHPIPLTVPDFSAQLSQFFEQRTQPT